MPPRHPTSPSPAQRSGRALCDTSLYHGDAAQVASLLLVPSVDEPLRATALSAVTSVARAGRSRLCLPCAHVASQQHARDPDEGSEQAEPEGSDRLLSDR